MIQCLAADQDACARLVETHARIVGTVIWRATGKADAVEDLSQEVFLRVFRGLPHFDGRAKLSTWIYTIAHRVAVDARRQAGRRGEVGGNAIEADLERAPAAGPDPEAATILNELEGIVRNGLAQLPDKYRLPLLYAAIHGLDYETIGAMLKVRPGTVKTLVFRGRQMLRDRMEAAT